MSAGRRLLAVLLALAGASGCCARYVNRRPDLAGQAVDGEGRPLRGVHVEVCTETDRDGAGGPGAGAGGSCLRRAVALSDRDGRFELERARELDFSCGKAKHVLTVVVGCARDGRLGHARFTGAWPRGDGRPVAVRLVVGPPAASSPPGHRELEGLAERICRRASYAGRRCLPWELGTP